MTGITEYYDNLKYNIRNAHNKKALRVLQKHGQKFMKMLIANPNIKPEVKERARAEFNSVREAIKAQEHRLK